MLELIEWRRAHSNSIDTKVNWLGLELDKDFRRDHHDDTNTSILAPLLVCVSSPCWISVISCPDSYLPMLKNNYAAGTQVLLVSGFL